MEYTRINWKNSPNTETPVTAENLNHMEDGIEGLLQEVNALKAEVTTLKSELDTLKAGLDKKILKTAENAISNITYRSVEDYGAENYGGYLVYDMGDNLVEPLANLAEEFL
jgi:regulator of replication initiation timing